MLPGFGKSGSGFCPDFSYFGPTLFPDCSLPVFVTYVNREGRGGGTSLLFPYMVNITPQNSHRHAKYIMDESMIYSMVPTKLFQSSPKRRMKTTFLQGFNKY